jgi:adenylate cyclase class IV
LPARERPGAGGGLGRVRKTGWPLLADQTRTHLDRVDRTGDFHELEVVLRDDRSERHRTGLADALCARSDVATSQHLALAYLDLLASSAPGTVSAR